MFEVFISAVHNLSNVSAFIIITSALLFCILTVGLSIENGLNETFVRFQSLKIVIIPYAIMFFLALIPSPSQLVETRIQLLKFHLADPEVVGHGVETIERIGQKLECKYLGCDKEKVKSK